MSLQGRHRFREQPLQGIGTATENKSCGGRLASGSETCLAARGHRMHSNNHVKGGRCSEQGGARVIAK